MGGSSGAGGPSPGLPSTLSGVSGLGMLGGFGGLQTPGAQSAQNASLLAAARQGAGSGASARSTPLLGSLGMGGSNALQRGRSSGFGGFGERTQVRIRSGDPSARSRGYLSPLQYILTRAVPECSYARVTNPVSRLFDAQRFMFSSLCSVRRAVAMSTMALPSRQRRVASSRCCRHRRITRSPFGRGQWRAGRAGPSAWLKRSWIRTAQDWTHQVGVAQHCST